MVEPTRVDLSRVAQDLQIRRVQVENVVTLLDEGNTVPFITRYRKERTSNLDEDTIRRIQDRVSNLRMLSVRRSTVLRSIEAQGKLTEELRAAIESVDSMKVLEDLYLPFKPKKRTLATQAREKGIEPLAQKVWNDDPSLKELAIEAAKLMDSEKELATVDDVLAGIGYIIAENIAENANARSVVRKVVWDTGELVSTKTEDLPEDRGNAYRDYFDYRESVSKIPPHRILALNRGEKVQAIKVRVEVNSELVRSAVLSILPSDTHSHIERLRHWAIDALNRLLLPSLEREVRRELSDQAEGHAVTVFARNLRYLLLNPPVRGKRLLAIDPGFRTGCKLAVVDDLGRLLDHGVAFPHPPKANPEESDKIVIEMAKKHDVQIIAIGNGTACRETEEWVARLLLDELSDLSYVIVNEAGASIYSASPIGREEFPDYDATLRGTISIGRRLQDPLSELVKIDAQHLGVGLYQHDVNTKRLKESLGAVVESCVNFVGVDLNTASVPLLRFVSGLNQLTARRLVEYRNEHGSFASREGIKQVSGIGESAYTQAAGFLKIPGGENPLDATWIHPESYGTVEKLLSTLGQSLDALKDRSQLEQLRQKLHDLNCDQRSEELEVGVETLRDMVEALQRPGRDPREDLSPPIFKKGILKIEDVQQGMELLGTVLNVVDFGVFVDIGLKDSGLIHISQLSTRYIKSPHDVVTVGQIVKVWVMSVDMDRRRVALTMVRPGTERKPLPREREKKAIAKVPPKSAPPRSKPPAPHKERKRRPARAPHLSKSALEGEEPLRGFSELKQFWKQTRDDK